MENLTYKISKSMYINLLTPKYAGGAGLRDDQEIFDYLNKTSGFRGKIVQLQID